MTIFSAIVLDPGSIAAWLVVGLIAGWLASKLLEEASYGLKGDIVLGLVGGFLGGLLFGVFKEPGFWGSTLVASIGACILIGGARAIIAVRGT